MSVWFALSSPTAYTGPVGCGRAAGDEVDSETGVGEGIGAGVEVGGAGTVADEAVLIEAVLKPQPAATNTTATTAAMARCGRMGFELLFDPIVGPRPRNARAADSIPTLRAAGG